MKPALEDIEQRMLERFPDARLRVSDDSHLHAGHAGSAGGAGHFTVEIVSQAFTGLTRVARHRLVYDAVADWMPHRVHALIVKAATPAESTMSSPATTAVASATSEATSSASQGSGLAGPGLAGSGPAGSGTAGP
jgi:BolA family transcriptional regulator, general stress-responsive regulator